MVKVGGNMSTAGKPTPLCYWCRLLQRRIFFTVVVAASITWADVGPWGSPWGRCYVERVRAYVVETSGAGQADLFEARSVRMSVEEPLSYDPSAIFSGLTHLPALLQSVFGSAAGSGGAGSYGHEDEPSASNDSSEHSRLSVKPLLHAVYDLFTPRQTDTETGVVSETGSPLKASHADATAATATDPLLAPASCSETHSCNFYGRMLQAVSDLIPRRLFNEDGEDDAEEIGFLSRRRSRKGNQTAQGRNDSADAEAQTYYGVLEEQHANKTSQGEVQAQLATVAAPAADGGSNLISDVIDYSFGRVRSFGKTNPRRISLWSTSPSPRYEDGLFHTTSTSETFGSSDSMIEEQHLQQQPVTHESANENETQQQQQQQQQATAPEGSWQNTEQSLEKSEVLDILPQRTHEEADTVDQTSPLAERGSERQYTVSDGEEASAATVRGQQEEKVNLPQPEHEPQNMPDLLQEEVEEASGRNSDGGSSISGGSSSSTNSRNSSIPPPATAKRDETLEALEEKEGEREAEQLTPVEDGTRRDDVSYTDTPVSPAPLGVDAGSHSTSLQSASSTDKKKNDNSRPIIGNDNTDTPFRSTSSNSNTTTENTRSSNKPAQGPLSDATIQSTTSNKSTRNMHGNSSIQTTDNSKEDTDNPTVVTSSRRSARVGRSVSRGGAKGLQLPFGNFFSTPLTVDHIFRSSTGITPAHNSYAASAQKKAHPSSPGRNNSSHRRKKRKPDTTLDTLREGGGLGSSFAHAVDTSGAIIEVLSASRDLQEAIEAIDLSAFGLPAAKSADDRSSRNSWEKLRSAVRAVEEVAHWSEALDRAIDSSKHLKESVLSNIRSVDHSSTSPSSLERRVAASSDAASSAEQDIDESDTTQQSLVRDWKAAAVAALTAAAQQAERLQTIVRAAINKSEHSGTSSSSTGKDSQLQHSLNVNNISIAIAALNAAERARSLLQEHQRRDEQKMGKSQVEREQQQQKEGGGAGSLLTRAAGVAGQVGALLQVNAFQEEPANGEYVMPLLRELYRVAQRLFELLDVSISVADESMDAMQLGKLLRMYEGLVEEGKLTAAGFRSPRVPKRIGQPRVSCANKGMTCCVPAAAAGPDWKQKQQHHLFLQNSPRQECKAVFVSRSSMLCASTPYHNSTCNITHTETAALDKYSVLLPVPAFSAAALCECEVSRKRNSDGLQTLEGSAEWTAGEIQFDLIDKARKGWQYVKRLSSTGNSLLNLLDNTLGKTEPGPYYAATRMQQPPRQRHRNQTPQHQQQEWGHEQEQRQQEELAEKPFNGLADAVTKILMNQQLLKLFNSEHAASAVIPPISVSMHLPKKTRFLLPNLGLSTLVALRESTQDEPNVQVNLDDTRG